MSDDSVNIDEVMESEVSERDTESMGKMQDFPKTVLVFSVSINLSSYEGDGGTGGS